MFSFWITGVILSIMLKTYMVTKVAGDLDIINLFIEASKSEKIHYICFFIFCSLLGAIESLLSWLSLFFSLLKLGEYHLEKNLEKVKP